MALLAQLRSAGLRLSSRGDQLLVEPKAALTGELREIIRQHKAELLCELNSVPLTAQPAHEIAYQDVLTRLAAHPEVQRAFEAYFRDDVLIVTLAIRGVGICELSIPASRLRDNVGACGELLVCLADKRVEARPAKAERLAQ